MPDSLAHLRDRLRAFAAERDWERFHTPKNLAMALMVEVAEVAEHLQWLRGEESCALPEATRAAVAEEIGDCLIYLTRLADRLDVDPVAAAHAKIQVNAAKYPADRVRGSAAKYTEYEVE